MDTQHRDDGLSEAGARRVRGILVGAWLAVAAITAMLLFGGDLFTTGHPHDLAASHVHPVDPDPEG